MKIDVYDTGGLRTHKLISKRKVASYETRTISQDAVTHSVAQIELLQKGTVLQQELILMLIHLVCALKYK